MGRLDRVQRISAVFRYLLIAGCTILGGAVIVALITPGQDWVSIGDGRGWRMVRKWSPMKRSGEFILISHRTGRVAATGFDLKAVPM